MVTAENYSCEKSIRYFLLRTFRLFHYPGMLVLAHLIIKFLLYYLSTGRLREIKNTRKFQTFSFKILRDLTWKLLVFWKTDRLRGGRNRRWDCSEYFYTQHQTFKMWWSCCAFLRFSVTEETESSIYSILLWVHIKFHNVVKPQNNFIVEIKYIEIGKILKNAYLGQYSWVKILILRCC